jgi:hypothetical protein
MLSYEELGINTLILEQMIKQSVDGVDEGWLVSNNFVRGTGYAGLELGISIRQRYLICFEVFMIIFSKIVKRSKMTILLRRSLKAETLPRG